MKLQIGKTYLVTTDGWFVAPDGRLYQSVFGTAGGIVGAEEALWARTNRHSTNWYACIGGMLIAGCQIHYCIRTDSVTRSPKVNQPATIYLADEEHNVDD